MSKVPNNKREAQAIKATTKSAASVKQILPKGLYLVATPIGNLGDITKRAIEIFTSADLILAEDTRVTRKLCSFFGIDNKIWRADEEATPNAIKVALEIIENGGAVAFASDAGTPSISDPGQRLAMAIIENGFEVYTAPGASSVLCALAVSGFDCRQFAFLGFVPPKASARTEFLFGAANLDLTIAFFETAPRLVATLKEMTEHFGNRRAMVCRELTKLFEEKRRGTSRELFEHYQENGAPKGEIVIVIERDLTPKAKPETIDIEELLRQEMKTNSVKDSAAIVAKLTGLARREIYEIALRLK